MAREALSWEGLHLYTDRLCLRTATPQDADALYDLFTDSDVMHGLGKEPVSAPEEARAIIQEWIDAWRRDGLGPFVIETAATNRQVVGQAGLMIFDTRGWTPSTWADAGSHAQPELGWALMRAHWGHGYATEAAAGIREWAYEHRPIERLVSLISSDNIRSQRVAERLGAIPTETITPAHSARKTTFGDIRSPARAAPECLLGAQHPGVVAQDRHLAAVAVTPSTSTSGPPIMKSVWTLETLTPSRARPSASADAARRRRQPVP